MFVPFYVHKYYVYTWDLKEVIKFFTCVSCEKIYNRSMQRRKMCIYFQIFTYKYRSDIKERLKRNSSTGKQLSLMYSMKMVSGLPLLSRKFLTLWICWVILFWHNPSRKGWHFCRDVPDTIHAIHFPIHMANYQKEILGTWVFTTGNTSISWIKGVASCS